MWVPPPDRFTDAKVLSQAVRQELQRQKRLLHLRGKGDSAADSPSAEAEQQPLQALPATPPPLSRGSVPSSPAACSLKRRHSMPYRPQHLPPQPFHPSAPVHAPPPLPPMPPPPLPPPSQPAAHQQHQGQPQAQCPSAKYAPFPQVRPRQQQTSAAAVGNRRGRGE